MQGFKDFGSQTNIKLDSSVFTLQMRKILPFLSAQIHRLHTLSNMLYTNVSVISAIFSFQFHQGVNFKGQISTPKYF